MSRKTILITGASRGIGRGIALYLSDYDEYEFILTCHTNMASLSKLKKVLNEKGRSCYIFSCDLNSAESIDSLWNSIHKLHLSVDALINNAGISILGLLQDTTDEQWNQMINTNLSSVFRMCKHALPDMIQKRKGQIINISSVWGIVGSSCEVAYSTTKGGINAFTKALGKELAPSNISVNAIACGAVDTSMNSFLTPTERVELENEIPAGRFCTPNEVGQMVHSVLTSPSYLTGQVISFDGGWI